MREWKRVFVWLGTSILVISSLWPTSAKAEHLDLTLDANTLAGLIRQMTWEETLLSPSMCNVEREFDAFYLSRIAFENQGEAHFVEAAFYEPLTTREYPYNESYWAKPATIKVPAAAEFVLSSCLFDPECDPSTLPPISIPIEISVKLESRVKEFTVECDERYQNDKDLACEEGGFARKRYLCEQTGNGKQKFSTFPALCFSVASVAPTPAAQQFLKTIGLDYDDFSEAIGGFGKQETCIDFPVGAMSSLISNFRIIASGVALTQDRSKVDI